MAGKPNTRNWNDVQLVIVSIALVLTLILWNAFAGPDRVKAGGNASPTTPATATSLPTDVVALTPTPLPEIKIMFGGTPPGQTASVPVQPRPRGGGGGGSGGGSGGGGGGTGGS